MIRDLILLALVIWLCLEHRALARYVDQIRRIQQLDDERLAHLEHRENDPHA